MSRDRLTESQRRLREAYALLSTWIGEPEELGTQETTHDRLIIARDYVQSALNWLGEVEDAMRHRE